MGIGNELLKDFREADGHHEYENTFKQEYEGEEKVSCLIRLENAAEGKRNFAPREQNQGLEIHLFILSWVYRRCFFLGFFPKQFRSS